MKEEGTIVNMTSGLNGNKYTCIIPNPVETETEEQLRETQTPEELLKPLECTCLYRVFNKKKKIGLHCIVD